ncbi:nicotinate (nicotinamide) nucleotide adenylyltransferase [Pigmentiphaga soli]|uniref:nicotinate (nicotinamide) nucleotide adenylyltransferase n=1 Tax=Pigmentiphaga soli TaxID=1007095 RepID=UPI0031E50300
MHHIGLLGGSFDPIHQAHLALAEAALDQLGLESVQLIPAAAPWQRAPLSTPAGHRAAMAELAIAGHPRLAVNRIELDRGDASYTIDTVRALKAAPGGDATRYVWILGADQLANFCTWHEWAAIVALAELAVAARPGSRPEPPPELAAELARLGRPLHRLAMPEMPISASGIRQRLAQGQAVDGLVPPAVLDYIRRHHLYQT